MFCDYFEKGKHFTHDCNQLFPVLQYQIRKETNNEIAPFVFLHLCMITQTINRNNEKIDESPIHEAIAIQTIADMWGVHRNTINRALKELERLEYITIEIVPKSDGTKGRVSQYTPNREKINIMLSKLSSVEAISSVKRTIKDTDEQAIMLVDDNGEYWKNFTHLQMCKSVHTLMDV